MATKLVSRNIIDLIDIDDDYSIVEIAAPAKWVGKTLKALELRTNYGINVLGIRKNPKAVSYTHLDVYKRQGYR